MSQIAAEPSMIITQNSTSTPTTRTLQRPTLQVGSQGTEVSELQATLKLLGYYDGPVDGIYSQETAEAVSAFQKAAGLTTNGVVDPQTWNRLFPPNPEAALEQGSNTCVCPNSASGTLTASNSATNNSRTQSVSLPILQLGMRGDAVTGVQERLKAKGFLQSSVDGVFGPETQAAVQAAQAEYELKPDGIVGTQTWLVLLR
jgi:peptidoglycan hydrolase-like protein with peptidoglycan-binding domain